MANRIKGREGVLNLEDSGTTMRKVLDTQDMTITENSDVEQFAVHDDLGDQTGDSGIAYEMSFQGLLSTDDPGQAEIVAGQLVPWEWWVTQGRTGSDPRYYGTVRIESIERTFPSDGRVGFSITAKGEGVLGKDNIW